MAVLALPLTPKDILAHMEFFSISLSLWERRVLLDLDNAVIGVLNKGKAKGDDSKGIKATDVAGIKAMFHAASRR